MDPLELDGKRDQTILPDPAELELHIGLVMALDGIRYTAIERSEDALTQRLSTYVAARSVDVLWPDSSRKVLRLLSQGRSDAAIRHYFEHVGDRWDPEYLHREVVRLRD